GRRQPRAFLRVDLVGELLELRGHTPIGLRVQLVEVGRAAPDAGADPASGAHQPLEHRATNAVDPLQRGAPGVDLVKRVLAEQPLALGGAGVHAVLGARLLQLHRALVESVRHSGDPRLRCFEAARAADLPAALLDLRLDPLAQGDGGRRQRLGQPEDLVLTDDAQLRAQVLEVAGGGLPLDALVPGGPRAPQPLAQLLDAQTVQDRLRRHRLGDLVDLVDAEHGPAAVGAVGAPTLAVD